MSERNPSKPSSADLRTACVKLRGMAYLIELCGNMPCVPLDEGDCFYGIGLILTDIHDEILKFARAVEGGEIRRAQVKTRRRSSKDKPAKSAPDKSSLSDDKSGGSDD